MVTCPNYHQVKNKVETLLLTSEKEALGDGNTTNLRFALTSFYAVVFVPMMKTTAKIWFKYKYKEYSAISSGTFVGGMFLTHMDGRNPKYKKMSRHGILFVGLDCVVSQHTTHTTVFWTI